MTILGQALLLGRPELIVYAACFLAVTAAFARWYEEPTLREHFGAEYEAYRRAVPGWWPRLRPWESSDGIEPRPPASPAAGSGSVGIVERRWPPLMMQISFGSPR